MKEGLTRVERGNEDATPSSAPARTRREESPRQQEKDDGENKKGKENEKEEDSKEKEGSSKSFQPSRKAIVIFAIVLGMIVIAGILYWLHARNFVSTDDAYTTGHVHDISPRVPGTVIAVLVDDNQHVKAGQVLVQLDPADYEVSLQKAKAAQAQARAQETKQDAVIAQSQAQVSMAGAQYERARQDYDRVAGLYTKDIKAVSKADVDAATATLTSAKAQAESARANFQAAQAERIVDQANTAASEAGVHDAELQLSYCDIVSPANGKVSKKTVETGRQVQPGGALMAIVPDDVWILANLKETQLERVQTGQRVEIKIDTLPHYKFYGTVDSIQEGSGATYSLLPPDNATGNFTKIVQRVPVKIVFDEESIRDFRDKIVPGLSVEPSIELGSSRNDKREREREATEEKQNRSIEKGK